MPPLGTSSSKHMPQLDQQQNRRIAMSVPAAKEYPSPPNPEVGPAPAVGSQDQPPPPYAAIAGSEEHHYNAPQPALGERAIPPPAGPPPGHAGQPAGYVGPPSVNPAQPRESMVPPPGMVAVPAAAVGRNSIQSASSAMYPLSGVAYGTGQAALGTDMIMGGVVGNVIGQRVKQHEIHQAMRDPNAPMVLVDKDSRAGRRAKRRAGRAERRQKRNAKISNFFRGKKSDGDESSGSSSD